MISEGSAELVAYWWSQAQASLASARRELEAGSYAFAVNRLYYAAFYAASAALLERAVSSRRYSGVRAAFHRKFIKSGLLAPEWGKLYDELFEDRQEADYVALVRFDHEYVEVQLHRCDEFLTRLRPLISGLPGT